MDLGSWNTCELVLEPAQSQWTLPAHVAQRENPNSADFLRYFTKLHSTNTLGDISTAFLLWHPLSPTVWPV